jgi:ferredoxin-NADP reductase
MTDPSAVQVTYKQLKITGIRQETHDVKTFVLESLSGPVEYKAGQYLTFIFGREGQELRRSYSIASSPVLAEPLSITMKRLQNGTVSRPLFDQSRIGDILLTTGAAGFFVLPEELSIGQQIFFLAAGSGIVPVFSLIKTALHAQPGLQLVLIYSNRSVEETVYYHELNALQEKFRDNFRIEFLFSSSPDLSKARLNKSLLEALVRAYATMPLDRILFYTCGPFPYMRMIGMELRTMGVPAEHIRKEEFSTVRPAARPVPPDTNPHHAHIWMHGKKHSVLVQYPQTILEAAKKQGLVLPYSCEVGKCGSCAARCLQGNVWMMYNEVLLNDEIRQGLVLTCSGFPIGGDVELSFGSAQD